MRLVTWNVNSLKARLPRVFELLEEHDPDVVCLQETKCADGAFPAADLAMAGYHAVDHSCGRWNGVALLVRDDLEVAEVQRGLPGEPDPEEGRWVEADVNGVRVVSTYVVNGRSPDHPMFTAKLDFLDAMHRRAAELAVAGPVILAGDLNVTRDDRDVWDPAMFVGATHVTPAERQRFAALLDLGFADAFREVEPDEAGFTWWDYRMGALRRNLGMRLDYVLVGEPLRVRTYGVLHPYRRNNQAGDKPSDHAPVLVEVERH